VRIVYFGTYSSGSGYPRNRVLIEGLRRNGVEVTEVHEEFWADAADKISGVTGGLGTLKLALRAAGVWARLARRYLAVGAHDAVVVGYTGQADVLLARALSLISGRPVVLDAFLSLYDTVVRDRGLYRDGGLASRLLLFLDRLSCRVSDLVLLDTNAHSRYLSELTGLPLSRFARVLVGEDGRSFPPDPPTAPRGGGPLRVLWFGTYVPLQGVEAVLGAAGRLAGEPVRIRMVGKGQKLDEFRARAESLPNVELVPRWVSYEELVEEIRSCHVSLGVFGTTDKASRVIPCKVYDALAVGRPVITIDSGASREVLTEGETALLVPPGDPDALAGAILSLAHDEELRLRLARAGHDLYLAEASPDALGRRLAGLLREL
jgi:glycosyltransferase involved in cell wall biosynthesis